eukprot:2336645-Alexandrium_andersonii.AAC.1
MACPAPAWCRTCSACSRRPGIFRTFALARPGPILATPCCLSTRARPSRGCAPSGRAAFSGGAVCRN